MTKLMSKREMGLFRAAINYCHAYQEQQGTYLSIEDTARKVVKASGFEWDEDDVAECCEEIMGQ